MNNITVFNKKIIIFAGHYGSGKTNIAVNCALHMKKNYERVAIADLDIVNPYFRTKDAADLLARHGVELIVSEFAGTNLDAPAMPAEAYRMIDDTELYSIIDVGGDDRGALALGRYAEAVKRRGYEMYFICNKFRPLTRTAEDALEAMREIEAAAGIPFTGIIDNPNLGPDTTIEGIMSSADYAARLSRLSGLPVVCTAVRRDLADGLTATPVFPIDIIVAQTWSRTENV